MKRIAMLCVFVAASGCAAAVPPDLPIRGAIIRVVTADGTSFTGELLAVQDSHILILERSVGSIQIDSVSAIEVMNGRTRDWMGMSFFIQFCPAVVFMLADVDLKFSWGSAAITVATWFAMDLAEPSSLLYGPIDPEQITELRKVARFPFGITPSALDELRLSVSKGMP